MESFTILSSVILAFTQVSLIDLALDLSRHLLSLILILAFVSAVRRVHRLFNLSDSPRKRGGEATTSGRERKSTDES
jgi:hypothetical protein